MAPVHANATGFWTNQLANNARQGRAMLTGLLSSASGSGQTTPRSGVLAGAGWTPSDLQVSVVSGLQMSVQPGAAIIARSGEGAYMGLLTPPAGTVQSDTPPGSNPRNDIVCMRIYDAVKGDTPPGGVVCRVEVITGTPAASPLDPVSWDVNGVITSFPTSGGGVGEVLARAQVSTGGVITLTDLRRSTTMIPAFRSILPGDSLGNSGWVKGEARFNDVTGGGDVWLPSGAWRGLRGLFYPRIAANGSGAAAPFTGSASTNYTISSQVIPDPGFPYRIRAGGQMFMNTMGASWMGSHFGAIMVNTTTPTGPASSPASGTVTSAFVEAVNAPGGNGNLMLPNRLCPTVFTGSNTVYMIVGLGSAGGATWGALNSRSDYSFDVEAVPA